MLQRFVGASWLQIQLHLQPAQFQLGPATGDHVRRHAPAASRTSSTSELLGGLRSDAPAAASRHTVSMISIVTFRAVKRLYRRQIKQDFSSRAQARQTLLL